MTPDTFLDRPTGKPLAIDDAVNSAGCRSASRAPRRPGTRRCAAGARCPCANALQPGRPGSPTTASWSIDQFRAADRRERAALPRLHRPPGAVPARWRAPGGRHALPQPRPGRDLPAVRARGHRRALPGRHRAGHRRDGPAPAGGPGAGTGRRPGRCRPRDLAAYRRWTPGPDPEARTAAWTSTAWRPSSAAAPRSARR